MELTFNQSTCPYLQTLMGQVQNQEQTQEVRISDGMPDIGNVLGCWAQPLIRSKEWHNEQIQITGGVLAWALYAPEDGTEPRVVDCWIPFQMKWEIPQTKRDGVICAAISMKSIDCRTTSARKLMFRGVVSAYATAMEAQEAEIFTPEQMPADVQLLHSTYPVEIPKEAGEKAFALEDELPLQGLHRIVGCEMKPWVTEQKVLSDKLVFRGACPICLRYLTHDGELKTAESELNFSQFTELDNAFGNNATATVSMIPTGLELDVVEEGKLKLKCGLAAQYVIFDQELLDLVEDAYSITRNVKPIVNELKLPVLLDNRVQIVPYQQQLHVECGGVLDVSACWQMPVISQLGDNVQAQLQAQYQLLYEDTDGAFQTETARGEVLFEMPSDVGNRVEIRMDPSCPKVLWTGDGVDISGEINLSAQVFATKGIPMVTGLQLGEDRKPDPERPSLVLRRVGDNRLWDLAKSCGSTVEAIEKANDLQEPVCEDRILLIPVN